MKGRWMYLFGALCGLVSVWLPPHDGGWRVFEAVVLITIVLNLMAAILGPRTAH